MAATLMCRSTSPVRLIWGFGLLLLSWLAGTIWHEVIGHGLVGVLAGGRISYVKIFALELWPAVRWTGFEMAYGQCQVDGISTVRGEAVHSLAGSMSTWCVAVVATILLWVRRWGEAGSGCPHLSEHLVDRPAHLPRCRRGACADRFSGVGPPANPMTPPSILGYPGRRFRFLWSARALCWRRR